LRLISTALLALAAAALATPAFAQSAPNTGAPADFDPNADTVTIGAGAAYLTDYEGSNDYRFTPAPGAIGSVDGYAFTLAGNRVSLDLIRNHPGDKIDLQFGPIGVVNFNRSSVKNIDDARVRALGVVGTAIELGGFVGVGKTGVITSPYDRVAVSLSYRHDVNGVHDSGIWQPTLSYFTPLSTKSGIGLIASAEHADDGYARTYFSVSPTQTVVSGLPSYSARGGWKNYSLGAIGTYSLTGNLLHGFKIVAAGSYTRLLNDFAASPLVSVAGSKDQWRGIVGLAYTF